MVGGLEPAHGMVTECANEGRSELDLGLNSADFIVSTSTAMF